MDKAGSRSCDGLVVAGTAVVLTGQAADTALQAVLIAIRSRRVNGLPESPAYRALAAALANARANARAGSADGLADVREPVGAQHLSVDSPTVPAAVAAQRLGLCARQVRRLAPRLGGRKVGGRWFVDEQALTDYETRSSAHC